MNSQNKDFNKRYVFVEAEAKDTEAIQKILRSESAKGDIEIANLRGLDPLSSFAKEGKPLILLLRDQEKDCVIGLGACILRPACIEGEIKTAGYLLGLKILPEYQKKTYVLAHAYTYLHEKTKEYVDFYYSTVLEANTAMLKMIAKKRKYIPEYAFIGNYTVYCCKGGISSLSSIKERCFKKKKYEVKKCTHKEVELFYAQEAVKYTLTYPSLCENDRQNADFYALYNEGKLEGLGYLLNQQEYKQMIVTEYRGIYKYLAKLPRQCLQGLGYPAFPKINEVINCLFMEVLVKENSKERALFLTQEIIKKAPLNSCVTMGLFEFDPLNALFSKIRHVKYRSKLFQIIFEKEEKKVNKALNNIIKLDVAFL